MPRRRNFAIGAACAVGYVIYYGIKHEWLAGSSAPFSPGELFVLTGCVVAFACLLGDGDGPLSDWFPDSDEGGSGTSDSGGSDGAGD